jgi:HK97 family phage major capsid protein
MLKQIQTTRVLKRTLIAAAMLAWGYAAASAAAGGDFSLAIAPVAAASGAQIRSLRAKKADAVKSARAITEKASAEGRDLTAEETADFDKHMASAKGFDAAIQREEALADAEAGMGQGGVPIREGAVIETTDNASLDAKGGFKSFGEFAATVIQGSIPSGTRDERLVIGAAAPGAPNVNESTGADGGFLIPPEFSKAIWSLSLGEDSLIPLTENDEISGNSMVFPKDESTPWGGNGVQVYWGSELKEIQKSKISVQGEYMQLHKLTALVPVSNEMLADGPALGSYLTNNSGDKIRWKANEAILFGDGIGKPLGALYNPGSAGTPAIVVPKEAGQAAASVDPKNITKMFERLIAGSIGSAFWLATPDILTPLEAMTIGQYPIYLPGLTSANAPYGMLKGRPLMLSEHANALGSQGDLNLLSLKGYRTITKAGGIEAATSMHLYFDADATAFRFIFRMNGKPIMSAPITPPKSANKRSHFVTLAERA